MTKPEDLEWQTAQGEVIKLGDMGSDHLLNVIRFLERGIKTAEAFDGVVHRRGREMLAAAKSVASKRGLLMSDGRTPTHEEEGLLAEERFRANARDDPMKDAVRRGVRPIEVKEDDE